LDIVAADGSPRTVMLDRVTYADWKLIAEQGSASNFKDAVSFTRIGERSAVLRIDSFVNYRQPVDPDTLYAPVFEALAAEGRDQLILDLRRNGGGSTDASQGLFSYLTPTTRRMKLTETFKTLDHDAYVDYINTWEKRAINPPRLAFSKTDAGEYQLRGAFSDATDKIKPAKAAFKGTLTILTSRNNSSGSTNLVSAVRAAREVTLIGEKTGGNPAGTTAGTIFFITLPESGVKLRVPIIRFSNNAGPVEDGQGLSPDIFAPDTVVSLRGERDPAMEAALAQLKT
jgi:C-terminal processing protease CtpA/Prc